MDSLFRNEDKSSIRATFSLFLSKNGLYSVAINENIDSTDLIIRRKNKV